MTKAARKTTARPAKKARPARSPVRATKSPAKKAARPLATGRAKTAKQASAKPAAARSAAKRADFGAPIAGFFAKQPPPLRPIVDALRALIEEAAPEASSSLKWGMPVYEIGGAMMCAVGAHKAHVNLIMAGPPDAFPDPGGRLSGAGKTGRHLKLTKLEDLPRTAVKAWLRKAAELARKK